MESSAQDRHNGFSLLEVATSIGIIVVLLAVLIPALSSARSASYLQRCAVCQRQIGEAWELYLADHDDHFPFIPVQPGWHYGGVRFSSISGQPFLDTDRPLTAYLSTPPHGIEAMKVFQCPADEGITDEYSEVGTGSRTAFRSYGTSFRANAALVDARIAEVSGEPRGLHRSEISTYPSRMLLMGDPVWHETYEQTGRIADWHGKPGAGNLLFLDGSVRFMSVRPRGERGPAVVEPLLPGMSIRSAQSPP